MVLSALSRAALALIAGLLLWSVAPSAFGWHTTVVMSDSMAPQLRVGDIAVSRPVAADQQLRLGQVLLVSDPDHPDRPRLHRLAAVRTHGQLTLKGDANKADDSTPVARKAVHGIGSLRVPFVGLPAYWLSTGQQGRFVLLILGLGGLAGGALAFRSAEPGDDAAAGDGQDGSSSGDDCDAGDDEVRAGPDSGGAHRGRVAAVAMAAAAAVGVGVVAPAQASAQFTAVTSAAAGWNAATYFNCKGVVQAQKPYLYYELGDASTTSGKPAVDSSGNNLNGTYQGTVTSGATAPCTPGSGGVTLNGSTGWISTPQKVTGPNTFTLQTWFRSTSKAGGELIGFNDSQTGTSTSSSYDRHLYLANSGQVVFGVYPGAVKTIVSPASYNNGGWHQATATLSPAGMQLYVDGVRVAADASVTTAQAYSGYWRIGWNNLDNWGPTTPTGRYFNGSLAGVAIYPTALSADDIAAGYAERG